MRAQEELALVANKLASGNMTPGEPLFTLRAQDVLAPAIVEAWADQAEAGGAPESKVNEARILANEMRQWQAANHSKRPD